MLKNPAYFHFYFIAAIVAFISAEIGFGMFHILKLDLESSDFWNYWLRDGV